ncbi:MAG: DUF1464 family protein [Thermosphaera sp.]
MRIVGIDPGTKSMDLCLLENGKVASEATVETKTVAEDPNVLINIINDMMPLDGIVVPSGYGVEVMDLSSIPHDVLEDWYYTFVLATTRENIEEGVRKGVVGANIYYAMVKIIKRLYDYDVRKLLIPGVINLQSVPLHRKLNKIDMGTADKLAVTVLGIHEVALEYGIPYDRVNYIHVELGFGYNAVIGVERGKIVDGIGGSFMPGPGFLTAGALDLEVAQALGLIEKKEVFTTGCAYLARVMTPEELVERAENDWRAKICLEAFIEGIVKAVYSVKSNVRNPLTILVSGRVAKIPQIRTVIEEHLADVGRVRVMKGLQGARIVKETAQGYAVVGDGLMNGLYSDLVKHVEIDRAVGSALDYVLLPVFKDSRLGRKFAELREVGFKSEAFNKAWWGM